MLSVIVPVYNVENYIEDCIQSLRNQYYRDLEIIIVDDGSTDSTINICKVNAAQDNRIKMISQSNRGVLAARITGIEAAMGEKITFVDGDDYIDKNMYAAMISVCSDSDIVTCGVKREEKHSVRYATDDYDEGKYEGEMFRDLISHSIYDFDNEKQQRLTPWLVNKIFRTDYMKEVANECRDCKISYAEDSVMLYRYLLKCSSLYICKERFYTYRYRQESAIHSNKDDVLIDINKVYLSLKSRFEIEDEELHLIEQLQKWIVIMTGYAFSHQMSFREDICPIEFMITGEALISKRVAIYGAGKCGSDYMRQLIQTGIKPVCWVDKHRRDFNILDPEILKRIDFDCLIIAVNSKETSEEIREELVAMGISDAKIHWRKPVRLY